MERVFNLKENTMKFDDNNLPIHDDQKINEEIINYERRKVVIIREKRPIVTYVLIAANIIVWALLNLYSMKSGKSYNELLSIFGAKVNIDIMKGQYWRFITPIFLHANITHLLINCYSLHAVGVTVEKIYGQAKFIFIYLVAGVMGSLLSFMFSINPAVGASGAIFGLLGALLYFGVEYPKPFRTYFGHSIMTTIAINLVYGFMNSGIDNFGHIGGLIGGFLASGIVKVKGNNTKWYLNKIVFIFITIVLGISGIIYGFSNNNNTVLVKLDEIYRHDANQEWDEVVENGQDILKKDSLDDSIKVEVLWMTVKAEAITGDYNKAVEHAQILKRLSPQDGYYLLGIVYYDMGQFELAKEELQRAKDINAPYSNIDELLRSIEAR